MGQFVLDTITRKLQVKLAAAHTTTALDVVSSYEDLTTTTFTAGANTISTNGTTAVDAVGVPGASTQRRIQRVSVYNADTVQHTVSFIYNDNATLRLLAKLTISPGETADFS